MNYREKKAIKELLARLITEEARVTGNAQSGTQIEKKRIA
jgi:hypothetical protein